MRPIDADKLREELLEYEITIKRVNKNRISVKEQAILLDINAIVTNSPTADTTIHAEWIDDGCLYKCSNCGHTEEYYDMSYCPNCGARMDE